MTGTEGVVVVIVDDHPVFVHGLASLLIEDGAEIAASVGTAAAGIAAARDAEPDVVIMDLHLPDLSGIEATRRILADIPGTRVLILTMDSSDTALLAALRAGARGYLLKDSAANSVGGAVASLARGELVVDAALATRLPHLLQPPVASEPSLMGLTVRELQILHLIGEGHGNAEIGRRLFLAEKTIRNQVTTILAKTGAQDRSALIALAQPHGGEAP